MGAYVEQALDYATDAWRTRSLVKCQQVYDVELKVNQAHIAVDAACVQLLALQHPMAADLRLIVAIIKINTDLERMVDLAVNIAHNTEHFLKGAAVGGPELPLGDLAEMSEEVRVMVREVLDAFVHADMAAARKVLLRDDTVDNFKRQIVQRMKEALRADVSRLEEGLNVIFMAKNLERIGDHATNIAEDVIFSASGEDVRHSGKGE
jgi:phosphate transport system protein